MKIIYLALLVTHLTMFFSGIAYGVGRTDIFIALMFVMLFWGALFGTIGALMLKNNGQVSTPQPEQEVEPQAFYSRGAVRHHIQEQSTAIQKRKK